MILLPIAHQQPTHRQTSWARASFSHSSFNQQGAALIIGLVLLAILTVLTASSMNSSTLSLRMADNIKQRELAEQGAESALIESLRSNAPLMMDSTVNYDDQARVDTLSYTYYIQNESGQSEIRADVDTVLKDRLAQAIGGDLNSAQGAGGPEHQHFELQATGTASRGSSSNQRMGFYLLVP